MISTSGRTRWTISATLRSAVGAALHGGDEVAGVAAVERGVEGGEANGAVAVAAVVREGGRGGRPGHRERQRCACDSTSGQGALLCVDERPHPSPVSPGDVNGWQSAPHQRGASSSALRPRVTMKCHAPRPSSPARPAGTRASAGTGSARAAAPGTRWSRRRGRRRRPARVAVAAAVRRARGEAGAAGRRAGGASCRACAPASASSTACSAAGWCPGSSCCSAASRASASRRSRAWRSATSPPRAGACSTSPARSPPPRCACAPSGCRARALDVPCWPRPTSRPCSATLDAERPEVCVVDSVQTLHAPELSGAAGSVGQVREVADRVTRAGQGARHRRHPGRPRHQGGRARRARGCSSTWSTACSQFEGERERTLPAVRALKNRFGPTDEVGVFEMRHGGLVEVPDASALFLGEATRAPGSVVLAAMEGSRPLLVEVQALVSPVRARAAAPRRQRDRPQPPRARARGARAPRRRGDRDGRRVRQRRRRRAGGRARRRPRRRSGSGQRRARCGALRRRPFRPRPLRTTLPSAGGLEPLPLCAFGEIGLTGELRSVGHPDRRLAEAGKFGLATVITPTGAGRGATEVATLREALRAAMPPAARAKAA